MKRTHASPELDTGSIWDETHRTYCREHQGRRNRGQATLESLPKTQTRYGADNMVGLKKVDSGCVWGSG